MRIRVIRSTQRLETGRLLRVLLAGIERRIADQASGGPEQPLSALDPSTHPRGERRDDTSVPEPWKPPTA